MTEEIKYFYLWVLAANVSTLYSYFWDLKMDWGFLQSNKNYPLLRKHLSYNHPNAYYIAIIGNLILRFSW